MDLSLTFISDPKLVLRAYRAGHRAAYVLRWTIGLPLIVLGLAWRPPGLAALTCLVLVGLELSVRWHLRPYLTGTQTVTVTMTDREYRATGSGWTASRHWSTFTKVYPCAGFWVLRHRGHGVLAIPRFALDPAQTEIFETAMRAKGLLPD